VGADFGADADWTLAVPQPAHEISTKNNQCRQRHNPEFVDFRIALHLQR
jgi:hypothetical protein